MKYQKTYAQYIGITFDKNHQFKTDDGQIISFKHFSRSGRTPSNVRKAWHEAVKKQGYRKALETFGLMPIGTRVKLYQKEERWCYRHLGE